jgi:orotate phosphoribosyltransferase
MELIPTQEEVLELLRRTGGLRSGLFRYPDGTLVSEYLQVALTMRDFQVANILSVALSRRFRSNSDVRALLPHVSICAPAPCGLPVAYGVAEALRAKKVFWTERRSPQEGLRFRDFLELEPGEKVILVNDILRTGAQLVDTKRLVEAAGGEVIAVGVIVEQRASSTNAFGTLPVYSLATIERRVVADGEGRAAVAVAD